MRLVQIILRGYRAVSEEATIKLDTCNVIVGKNDAGKSIILKGLDLFLNDVESVSEIANAFTGDPICEIELHFTGLTTPIIIDEAIPTTLSVEELVAEDGVLRLKKSWDTSKSKIQPETYIWRKKYLNDDFILLTERDLMRLCQSNQIDTRKANGEEFNNVEKRQKLRDTYATNQVEFAYEWEKLPATGKSRGKTIYDELRRILPRFEYFHADTSLSESDTVIQRHFKGIATKALQATGGQDLERSVGEAVRAILGKITDKINQVLPEDQQIQPAVSFNWTNVVQTGFRTSQEEVDIPLSFRGDGFRRLTMMSFFEYLAEENTAEHQDVLFGFEEPETFLHPQAQEHLHEKLVGMAESGYQVIMTTHSPVIVANTDRSRLVHIRRAGRDYYVEQNLDDLTDIIQDLGITPGNQFLREFERAKVVVLVEGPDDVKAFHHAATEYKNHGVLASDFHDLEIVLLPIGGCDSVKHWQALGILNQLAKPFYIVQDSDKDGPTSISPTEQKLVELGLTPVADFWVLKKRALENYIHLPYLQNTIRDPTLAYTDYTHVKNYCKAHPAACSLGGKKVCDKHFCGQSFDDLRNVFSMPDGSDELQAIFDRISAKL